jgi:hypothetical protein
MCIPNIIRVIKLRRMGWVGHVARVEEKIIEYRVLAGKPEGKKSHRLPRPRCEDNIKIDINAVRLAWIHLAQDGTSGGPW